MSNTGGFFTASGGVPSYTAAQWAAYFQNFFSDGVVNKSGGALVVTAQGTPAMAVNIAAGMWVSAGYWGNEDALKSLAIGSNSSGSTRIDTVIGEINISTGIAIVKLIIGTPGAGAPTLTNSSTLRQVQLANVTIANGASSIVTGNISDQRIAALPQVSLTGLNSVLDDPLSYFQFRFARATG